MSQALTHCRMLAVKCSTEDRLHPFIVIEICLTNRISVAFRLASTFCQWLKFDCSPISYWYRSHSLALKCDVRVRMLHSNLAYLTQWSQIFCNDRLHSVKNCWSLFDSHFMAINSNTFQWAFLRPDVPYHSASVDSERTGRSLYAVFLFLHTDLQ